MLSNLSLILHLREFLTRLVRSAGRWILKPFLLLQRVRLKKLGGEVLSENSFAKNGILPIDQDGDGREREAEFGDGASEGEASKEALLEFC